MPMAVFVVLFYNAIIPYCYLSATPPVGDFEAFSNLPKGLEPLFFASRYDTPVKQKRPQMFFGAF
jgi:hypothetical protein